MITAVHDAFIDASGGAAPAPVLAPAPSSGAGCARSYVVKSGDSCWKVWTDNGIGEAKFRQLNPGVNCDALWVRLLWIKTQMTASRCRLAPSFASAIKNIQEEFSAP